MLQEKKIDRKISVFLAGQILVLGILYAYLCPTAVYAAEPEISAPSAILMEASTGEVIYEKNADEQMHPASITKIMTLILIFDALSQGKIHLEDQVTVSEHASSMGGSQVYLEVGETQTVNTMIKCIAVASANDASVAMAEHIWGSEGTFVDKMNERAQGLGMSNTHFVNCCGLDDDAHLMSARDVALMSRELITKYPQIHDYSTIWMDTITHSTRRGDSEFGLSNTNKLIKQYEYATGLKTGSTSQAKCCLSATAQKDGTELIAVIMAAPNSKNRFADATSLLSYGFGIITIYKDEASVFQQNVPLKGGKKKTVSCTKARDFNYVFKDSSDTSKVIREEEYMEDLKAPVERGAVVGQIVYKYTPDGGEQKVLGSVDIIANETVEKAKFLDYIKRLFS